MTTDNEVREFAVDVPDAVLDDLRDRLARTRWPDQLPGSGWEYGTDLEYLRELCSYWAAEFDWRKAEADLNAWPQYTTTVDGQLLHCIHARSPEPGALPLVITHGWPGSVFEFMKVLGPLTDPRSHGGSAGDAFHVVCPSIPGYQWSGPTAEAGWDIRRVARAEAELMTRLGYRRFGAQGGDWGGFASVELASQFPERVVGIHLNLVIAHPPDDDPGPQNEDEEKSRKLATWFNESERGYSNLQGTKPQTLAYGLTDSPAGLAGWIVEKFRTWSDCDGDVEARFTKDELLANITAYWVTETIGSSTRLYYESRRAGRIRTRDDFITVPTGCALFPGEIMRPARRWAEARYNVVRWTEMTSGGHFAAMEEPEQLVEDVRAFFRPLRAGS
jgi:pimeloyl-ACP methyl ester carboxylesterase